MKNPVYLWPAPAPWSAQSPDQAQPSLLPFEYPGAKTAVVVCAGGAYAMKAEHEADPVAEMLNGGGISAFVLDYRVSPCHYLAPLSDAQRAIRTVRAMGYQYVGILGFSAGGNLACNAATHYDAGDHDAEDPIERVSCRPDFFVPCYPVVSFTQFPHYGSFMNLVGDSERHDLERFFSAELNVTPDTPPAFIWHTANDELVPVENSLLLAGALSRAGVFFEMHIFPKGCHGLGLAEVYPELRGWTRECIDFINRYFY